MLLTAALNNVEFPVFKSYSNNSMTYNTSSVCSFLDVWIEHYHISMAQKDVNSVFCKITNLTDDLSFSDCEMAGYSPYILV